MMRIGRISVGVGTLIFALDGYPNLGPETAVFFFGPTMSYRYVHISYRKFPVPFYYACSAAAAQGDSSKGGHFGVIFKALGWVCLLFLGMKIDDMITFCHHDLHLRPTFYS